MDYFMGWFTFQSCSAWLALPHIYGLRNQKHQGKQSQAAESSRKGMGFLLRSTAIKDPLRILELRQYLPLQHPQHHYQPLPAPGTPEPERSEQPTIPPRKHEPGTAVVQVITAAPSGVHAPL